MTYYRAKPAPAYEGKPTWHGEYAFDAGEWRVAASSYGPIAYACPQAAIAGAKVCAGMEVIAAAAI